MSAFKVPGARLFCLLGALVAVTACGTVTRRAAPPTMFAPVAPVGFPLAVRALGSDRRTFVAQLDETRRRIHAPTGGDRLNILAISGGGAGGAFGAGALVGLERLGQRPQFEVVTGVSTGALLAPFAFLGPTWDPQLVDAFTSGRTEHLLRSRGVGILFHPGVYRGEPLVALVDHFVVDEMLAAVAAEAAKGRLLLVATTDLDKEETVIWNMGMIASQGGEAARKLFRDVLLASASIPGLFPPVLIHVEGLDNSYDEMHVDGGASVPFFVAPEVAQFVPFDFDELHGANLYVLYNGQLGTTPRTTREKTVSILMRSFNAEQSHASRAMLALTAEFSHRYGMNFQFSDIPTDYPYKGPIDFHKATMQSLFNYAADCAAHRRLWTTPEQAEVRSERAQSSTPGHTAECPLD